jgi:hypothetical protein
MNNCSNFYSFPNNLSLYPDLEFRIRQKKTWIRIRIQGCGAFLTKK